MMDYKKPEKLSGIPRDNAAVKAYNGACDLWQAYHDQEMRKKDEEIKKLKRHIGYLDKALALDKRDLSALKHAYAEIARLKKNLFDNNTKEVVT